MGIEVCKVFMWKVGGIRAGPCSNDRTDLKSIHCKIGGAETCKGDKTGSKVMGSFFF